ncbi:uncharacterized protein KGF55_005284 [Candida pseudojiufengensis]|uniref:uncharacterized protein n=1 Tax=Candida pseudojiufengensis TaxID=497109 RepID=UPI00222466C1|nr:uncharacterized protein KGF55_005284 [Candida pseudojiufengensis]KAI5959640.1 hypothetical protein KGF55_005284 [Candida pseudojiufengensis]
MYILSSNLEFKRAVSTAIVSDPRKLVPTSDSYRFNPSTKRSRAPTTDLSSALIHHPSHSFIHYDEDIELNDSKIAPPTKRISSNINDLVTKPVASLHADVIGSVIRSNSVETRSSATTSLADGYYS